GEPGPTAQGACGRSGTPLVRRRRRAGLSSTGRSAVIAVRARTGSGRRLSELIDVGAPYRKLPLYAVRPGEHDADDSGPVGVGVAGVDRLRLELGVDPGKLSLHSESEGPLRARL